MIATLRAAADLLRANADLLGRHGYTVSTVIATLVAVANRTEYNGAAMAVRSLAARILATADGIDAVNGITAVGSIRTGLVITVHVGAPASDANALTNLAADLIGVA